MNDLARQLADLVRRAATELPPDVADALRAARAAEAPGSPGAAALGTILENAGLACAGSVPVCQDTGTPAFWFDLPDGTPTLPIREAARDAHRRLRQVEFRTQGPDHPILWAAGETYYLKFFIFQVVSEH